jgi:putative ABC transport system substrate-binding protein
VRRDVVRQVRRWLASLGVAPARQPRRALVVALALALVGWPVVTTPQSRPFRVGFLAPGAQATDQFHGPFRTRLRELGYVEGQNVTIEDRWAEGRFNRLPRLAAELVRLEPDVLVTVVTQASLAARDATATIPIVMIGVADPVAAGLVTSLARPGGNVTGTSGLAAQLVGKQLELIRETFPDVSRVTVLWNPANAVFQALQLREVHVAARALRVEVRLLEARSAAEIDRAVAAAQPRRPLWVLGDPLYTTERARIARLALAHRVPVVGSTREMAEAGAVLAYGPNYAELSRRSADYVDRILKGARPADLPVEEPTTFELVVNLGTARVLGLTLPRPVLLRADRVIQ